MEFYLTLFSVPVVITLILGLRIYLSIKNPPYIAEKKGYKNTISVNSFALSGRGHGFMREFIFIKRKNGKYRIKYSPFDWFCILFPLLGSLAVMYIVLKYLGIEMLEKYPDIGIPFVTVLVISLIQLNLISNFSLIASWINFRKWIKKLPM